MKKFIKKIIFLIMGLLGVFLFVIAIFIILPKDDSNYMASLIDKHNLLKQENEERIIFVGGSNLAFGLDSQEIQKYTNKRVINTALHAGIGLKFMIRDIEPFLKTGDVVIIVPEYSHFISKDLYNGEKALTELILKYYPKGILYLDRS